MAPLPFKQSPATSPLRIPSACGFFTGPRTVTLLVPPRAASGQRVPTAAAARVTCGVVAALAGPSSWRTGGVLVVVGVGLRGMPGLCLKGGGGAPPPNAPPSTPPEGTSATPIPPPPALPTARDCPPTDFTARPNRFVTALSLPPERPPLQANPWGMLPTPLHVQVVHHTPRRG